MSITAAQIVADACAIAKCPGFTSQGGRALNLVLSDLVLHRNLKVNLVSTTIAIPANSNGPFNLESDYLRTYELMYYIEDQPYFLQPSNRAQFDSEPNKSTTSNYPYEWATDLSPVANGGLGLLYIYPQSNQNLTMNHRYMVQRADITTPETSSTVPWFADQDYLVHATAMRLMRITDDARYDRFVADCERMLQIHLLTEGDEQQVVKEVKLDPRRFRTAGSLRPTKLDPWQIMGIRDARVVRFTPIGLADAYDATDKFLGACRSMQNLVFDQSNPSCVIPRPGVGTAFTSFAGFTSPTFISCQVVVGNYIFGMVSTGLTAGHDQPFCYNMSTNSFITISNVTSGNSEGRPASPSTTGAWTPPTMAVIGVKIIITHPGYTGTGSNFFGVIDITNPAAPAYSTMNTTTHALPSVPTFVANFNNRAYFICGNAVYYSDVLVPTSMTNAGQALTVGDTSNCTALSGLPIQTTTAGVAAALIVFKTSQIWQITGDAAISGSLALNYLSLNVGSVAPRSVQPSPIGTIFVSQDSAYVVNPLGAVIPLSNQLGSFNATSDIRQPFNYCTQPTRISAAYSNGIYRMCIPTIIDGNVTTNDYWFDTKRMRWNGPHTFVYDTASSAGGNFVLSGAGSGAKLFYSYTVPSTNTVYNDNGTSYLIDLKTADFPNTGEMAMNQIVESTIALASSGASQNFSVSAFDDAGNYITSTNVKTNPSGSLWGSNYWGDGSLWKSSLVRPQTYLLAWSIPIVFNRIAIEIVATAGAGVAIDSFFARTQKTGYTLQS